ncbi:MAG: TetR/AcrR family transcriptional regulator [Meiothermus sp.]|uniref:TetR/AcrR family transcriptional regulator n=1 Tax=Meiothermus sp. TaxID=1955249 RepID=UPI0025F6C1A8|nr:TetR/AcrR family transcriptional regulator [Meiothermus sp.]MCS7059182.1 TetR/AcrR family transcriptional regulator [Meiothermus sp.]MCS7194842.1 TetR/AcrR family transcriptional regulator [Meiothermus sp.]MCX7740540.1 TetR/AcrR family transcriptional regulator [Meiothermus sp.]MDW8090374.1 TetR/AcrR family transcriptional regulator [Meiothermus sp.]MDW8481124.1 TetR/AcrR family transcriptional regulator [Meiothermus sp.]
MANNRPFEERRPERGSRRDEILNAAGRLFSRRGFHATSMRDLARAVNLQGGSLYAHIASKEEVLFELVNRAADEFLNAARAIPENLPAKERLTSLVRSHLQVIVRELDNATVFFHEWKFLRPELQERIKARRDEYESHFRQTIEAGVKQGEFQVEDVRLSALFVLSALNWTYHWYRPEGKLSLEELAQAYSSLILRTLGAKAP